MHMLQFSCEKTLLQSAVNTASRTVAAKSSIPALEGLLLEGDEQLTVSGYNMQTGIRTSFDADIREGGRIVLNARLFGEIIRNVINCLYISLDGSALHIAFNNPNVPGKLLVNGPAGATGVTKIATFGMGFVLNLIDSRSGRAIMAIRDNRIAAEAMGLNVTKYKMMAFVTSAVLAGMAGALYGLNFSTVAASKFKFDTSILVLVFVVLGGIGNIRGSIISATLLTILPELLRAFANYRMLIYAIVLILVMLATNNPTLRSLVQRIIPHKKGQKKEADEA